MVAGWYWMVSTGTSTKCCLPLCHPAHLLVLVALAHTVGTQYGHTLQLLALGTAAQAVGTVHDQYPDPDLPGLLGS